MVSVNLCTQIIYFCTWFQSIYVQIHYPDNIYNLCTLFQIILEQMVNSIMEDEEREVEKKTEDKQIQTLEIQSIQ